MQGCLAKGPYGVDVTTAIDEQPHALQLVAASGGENRHRMRVITLRRCVGAGTSIQQQLQALGVASNHSGQDNGVGVACLSLGDAPASRSWRTIVAWPCAAAK